MVENDKFHSAAGKDIRFRKKNSRIELIFDSDPDAIQSALDIQTPHKLVMLNLQYLMAALLFIETPKKILLLGVGGGSIIHYLKYHLPDCDITAVDNNGELLRLCSEHMQIAPTGDKPQVYCARCQFIYGK